MNKQTLRTKHMGKFLIPFIIITISEVYLMQVVAEKTGFLFLLGFVMFTGFLGITLAKMQGRVHLQKIQKDLGEGKLPENPVIEGLMILVAAAVLITPGFITDFLGFMLLVPWIRKILAPKVSKMLKPKSSQSGSGFTFYSNINMPGEGGPPPEQRGSTVEGDFFDMPDDEEPKGSKNIEDQSKD